MTQEELENKGVRIVQDALTGVLKEGEGINMAVVAGMLQGVYAFIEKYEGEDELGRVSKYAMLRRHELKVEDK